MKKLIWIALVIILASIVVFTGCGTSVTTTTTTTNPVATTSASTAAKTTSTIAAPVKGGTLKWLYVYSLQKAPGWPTDTTNVQRVLLAWTVFEPLIRLGLDGVPQPYLATSWKWAPDYKSITFNLRKNVKFHDGTPFTSEAVVTHHSHQKRS